ncbi:MAG: hypothetical protein WDZ83_15310 [Rhizobiaceae bacterium]
MRRRRIFAPPGLFPAAVGERLRPCYLLSMRFAAAFLSLLATPAAAWEFTPMPVCTLSNDTDTGRVVVTYDPRLTEPYEISVTGTAPWPDAPVFSMRFDGQRGLVISTNRHRLSDGGRTLSVTDSGFGNVLDGLEFNNAATALAGDIAVPFPLAGAAPEVRAFRACVAAPTA